MSDLAATAVAMQQAQTANLMQIAMVRQQHQMEQGIVAMLAEAVESAPPPAPQGQGLVVDKRA